MAECIKYLEKRHPLYFLNSKMQNDQVTDLIKRLIFRVKQMESQQATIPEELEEVKKENEPPKFKSGSQLPTL